MVHKCIDFLNPFMLFVECVSYSDCSSIQGYQIAWTDCLGRKLNERESLSSWRSVLFISIFNKKRLEHTTCSCEGDGW